jgi:hypothetical protein
MVDTINWTNEQWHEYEIRTERNKLLLESDWTQGADSPLSDSDKTAWATYRQSLRDFMDGLTIPTNDKGYILWEDLTWPTKPE